ncbi:polyphosphate kinase 2 [Thioalkalivibrio sp. XN8]|uniref:polyphosphate kinase 2 n=1 Tax=Thioalkalivibrio sp. XN8 TaxID=2712863 RepID=UPI0013EABB97|nr:polyphosphate kinase 2 [Thioalkalivibrio sp. XN8]NGP53836.1 polyphosphate kinase 2 [Thioalkalivibrio sp. XN8]
MSKPKKKKKAVPETPTVAVCPVLSLSNLYDRPLGRPEAWYDGHGRLKKKPYEQQLALLQVELVKMQEWVRHTGRKVVVIFEGRDAAGKGGAIKRVVEKLNPRVCRIAALPVPTEREQQQWYLQRYVAHLPSGGEIVLFDRSWYNRALVERVMGFCSDQEYRDFVRSVPEFERMLVRSGTLLIKYWFSISDDEQERRFQARVHNPLKRWKLSPMDLESRRLYREYSVAKDEMMEFSDIPEAPWWTVPADDKLRARLNCIAHLLSCVPYEDVMPDPPSLPPREKAPEHRRPHVQRQNFTPIIY